MMIITKFVFVKLKNLILWMVQIMYAKMFAMLKMIIMNVIVELIRQIIVKNVHMDKQEIGRAHV